MSNVDPGGGDDGERVDLSDTQSTPNLSTLQESFSQQQVCHSIGTQYSGIHECIHIEFNFIVDKNIGLERTGSTVGS